MTTRADRRRWTELLLAGALGLGSLAAVTGHSSRRADGTAGPEWSERSPSPPLASPLTPAIRSEVPPPPPADVLPAPRGAAAALAGTDPADELERESAFFARFVELARVSRQALEDRAADVLAGHGPDREKTALLRALADAGSPRTSEFLELAVEGLPDAADSGHESVPSFALRSLAHRAADEPAARLALERLAWGDAAARLAPELRRRSVAALCALATPEEAVRVARHLAGELDASVRASGIEVLCANPRVAAAEVLGPFGLERPAPSTSPVVEE
jgi:hypothetical protein